MLNRDVTYRFVDDGVDANHPFRIRALSFPFTDSEGNDVTNNIVVIGTLSMDCGPNNPEDFSIGEYPEGEYYDILAAGRSCSCSDDGTSLCLNGNKGVAITVNVQVYQPTYMVYDCMAHPGVHLGWAGHRRYDRRSHGRIGVVDNAAVCLAVAAAAIGVAVAAAVGLAVAAVALPTAESAFG